MKTILLALLILAIPLSCPCAGQDDYEQKMRQNLERIIQEQIEQIHSEANSTQSENEENVRGFVLSVHIRSFKDIPDDITKDIETRRQAIRELIRRVAMDIEVHADNSGRLSLDDDGRLTYVPNPGLPGKLNEKRRQLVEADFGNRVSVRSAVMAIRLLAGINDEIRNQAKQARTRQEKEQIYMTQAVYVYEIADIVLELINQIELEGKDVIINLHKDAQQRVRKRTQEINGLIARARRLQKDGTMSEERLQGEIQTYELMLKANQESLAAWDSLLKIVNDQESFLNNLRAKKALIEYKRDKAKVQLETLRDLRQVAELKDTIGSLDDLVSLVDNLDLLVLDEDTVRILLGYGAPGSEE